MNHPHVVSAQINQGFLLLSVSLHQDGVFEGKVVLHDGTKAGRVLFD